MYDPSCVCGLGEETSFDLICECPIYTQLRHRTLGGEVLLPSEVPGVGPFVLDRFLLGTVRFTR